MRKQPQMNEVGTVGGPGVVKVVGEVSLYKVNAVISRKDFFFAGRGAHRAHDIENVKNIRWLKRKGVRGGGHRGRERGN